MRLCEHGVPIIARLFVHLSQIRCLWDKGGMIIVEMRRVIGASVHIFPREHVAKYDMPNDEVVQVGLKISFKLTDLEEAVECAKARTAKRKDITTNKHISKGFTAQSCSGAVFDHFKGKFECSSSSQTPNKTAEQKE